MGRQGLKDLAEFARTPLAHRPTPLEPMPRLSRQLGGPRLLIKRDDCTGLGMGGNKVRQLEFHFGAALAGGATCVLITGAVQSNYVRTAAAAAAKLGLECHVQLEDRVAGMSPEYAASGNVLLDRLFGARIHRYPQGEDEAGADRALEHIAARLRESGVRPYVIHLGPEHPPLGALAYVEAASEMLEQAAAMHLRVDAVVLASGSGVTHAGMLVGLRRAGSNASVYGICIRRAASVQRERLMTSVRLTEKLLDCAGTVSPADVLAIDEYLGPAYGIPGSDTLEAIAQMAQEEGILLDPVYTGKAAAGLIGLVEQKTFASSSTVVFLHTGGTPALFGYRDVLEAYLDKG